MPYSIRKQKCKQSDGDSGSYTLSYTDNKGKAHSACHTSRKKARGQIAAIEGPYEGATVGVGEASLREAIRYLLESEDAKIDVPSELEPKIVSTTQLKPVILTWNEIRNRGISKKSQSSDVKEIEKIISDGGPNLSNRHGEPAVVAALNILGGPDTAKPKSESSGHDLEIENVTNFGGKSLELGAYEVKTLDNTGALSRLGAAKAVSVASQKPLLALTRLGREYASIIVDGGLERLGKIEAGPTQDAYNKLTKFFEGSFPNAKDKKRYQNMAALLLPKSAVDDLRSGSEGLFFTEFKEVEDAFRKANLLDLKNPEGVVTVVSDTSGPAGELDQYVFDSETWDLQVQPYLKGKIKDSPANLPDKDAVKDLREALKEMWSVIRDVSSDIQKLGTSEFWDTLAEKTQSKGRDGIKGVFAVDANGIRLYSFPELTVKSVVEQGRLELMPKNESISNSHMLRSLIKEMMRHAK